MPKKIKILVRYWSNGLAQDLGEFTIEEGSTGIIDLPLGSSKLIGHHIEIQSGKERGLVDDRES